jgi:hypothetical protein
MRVTQLLFLRKSVFLVSNSSQLHDQGIHGIRAGYMGKVFVFFPGELPAKAEYAPGGKSGIEGRWAERSSILGLPQLKFLAQIEFLAHLVPGGAGSLHRDNL